MSTHVVGSPPADSSPHQRSSSLRRALVLAGGGMRVAYQAGVLQVLLGEAGLHFHHADGTSGGTINLAMLFSGLTPDQMADRWRTLNVRDFVSFMPLREYLRGPNARALGDADGIIDSVFPHLGIDVASIRRATGMVGTFNVCNFSRKRNVAIPHTDIDLPRLVAGISLPIFMPAVLHEGAFWTDAVWIKDANLMEAVRRGADEIWLVWCIGNTTTYQDGPFRQYVHMIEMSANGVLFEELDHIRALNERIARGEPAYGQTRPITLHVVKPRYPLPLDPDFYAGNITAAELIAQGQADARRYVAERSETGVPLNETATAMQEAPEGSAAGTPAGVPAAATFGEGLMGWFT